MGTPQKTTESGKIFEDYRSKIEEFFQKTLERLNLTVPQLEAQTKQELQNSLAIVEDAIHNPSAFGILKISMTAKGSIVMVQSKSEHHFEVGILPLLLERKNVIIKRLASLGGDLAQTERTLHEEEVGRLKGRIRKLDLSWRIFLGIILWSLALLFILQFPSFISWTWWTTHSKVVPLTVLAVIAATGLVWALLETSKNRRWFAIGSIIIAAVVAGITLI